jgi:hypothetical protein
MYRAIVLSACLVPLVAGARISTDAVHAAKMAPTFQGYYDGHLDTYLSTDVSDKAQAAMMHINYPPVLKAALGKSTSLMYMTSMNMMTAPVVFGAEPGSSDYSPLWQEVLVTWKTGVTPVKLLKDDQIKALAKKGDVKLTFTSVVLNCSIIVVGKGG